MSDNKFAMVESAFATAKTAEDYYSAKRAASRLGIDDQFRVVDHIIACRRRLADMGVL